MPSVKERTGVNNKYMSGIFRKHNTDILIKNSKEGKHALKKTLGAFDLTILGIGAIIGAGIFTLSGTAAAGADGHLGAGPGLTLSFVISGMICCITALCYAEVASMIPVAGSTYTYAYATMGEVFAWMIGWILMLEYAIGSICVACGWSGYFYKMLEGYQTFLNLPDWLVHPPYWLKYDYTTALMKYKQAGIAPDFPTILGIPFSVNILALLIVVAVTCLLYYGVKESAKIAGIMVVIKVAVILMFLGLGAFYVQPENFSPFMPNGLPGVLTGAFLIFFAYIGFDAVSTAAEETKNPQKNLPIGIIASLAICTILYIAVSGVLTGMVKWNQIDIHAPIAAAMSSVGHNWMAGIISIGAVAGLSSVILVLILGATRILFAMARDGLLPKVFSGVHPKFGTPHIITIATGIFVSVGTLFFDINKAAELTNIGTLTAFIIVCLAVIFLRYKDPDRERGFRVPFVPILPAIGVIMSFCLIIFTFFNPFKPLIDTFIIFTIWVILGFSVYMVYGSQRSHLAKEEANLALQEKP